MSSRLSQDRALDRLRHQERREAMTSRLRVALIGTSARTASMYLPILRALQHEVELVAVWSRRADSARAVGERAGVPWFTEMDVLMRETTPQLGVVSVASPANGQVGLMAVHHGLHVLLETPIALDLSEADAIISAAQSHGVKVEVAEQFHRRPMEQIKLKLLDTGMFGRVHSAFNDFAGHGYHGVSVLRSYVGFDVRPLRVMAATRTFPLAPHWSRLAGTRNARNEVQEHAIIEFEGGALGLFHWTDVGYDSALRWWRSSRFLAENGMGISVGVGLDVDERLSLLTEDGEAPRFITLERRFERVDGGALEAVVAHTGHPEFPTVTWENPFRSLAPGHSVQWHDDEIGVASCLMSLVQAVRSGSEPSYGPLQSRLDQEIVLAFRRSSLEGHPVELPLPR